MEVSFQCLARKSHPSTIAVNVSSLQNEGDWHDEANDNSLNNVTLHSMLCISK